MVKLPDGETIEVLSVAEPESTDVVVSPDGIAYWIWKSAGIILKGSRYRELSILLRGLNEPVGITLDPQRRTLFLTEVPTPGLPGSEGEKILSGKSIWKHGHGRSPASEMSRARPLSWLEGEHSLRAGGGDRLRLRLLRVT